MSEIRTRSGSNYVDLEYLLFNRRPMSWNERCQLKGLLDCELRDVSHNVTTMTNSEILEKIDERISFFYLPGAVCSSSSSSSAATSSSSSSTVASNVEEKWNNAVPTQISLPTSSLEMSSDFLFVPLKKGVHVMCRIQRQKSTLQTVYRMYLEEIVEPGSHSLTRNRPLLIAKRSHGLTFACTISSLLDDCEIKDKDSSVSTELQAKISKSGSYYTLCGPYDKIKVYPHIVSISLFFSFILFLERKISMRYGVMDKLVHLQCIAELGADLKGKVDDAILQSSLDSIATAQGLLFPFVRVCITYLRELNVNVDSFFLNI